MTACHVVDDDGLWDGFSVYKSGSTGKPGKEFPAVTLSRDLRRDICMVYVRGLSNDRDLRQARIQTTSRKMQKGDRVTAVGTGGKEFQLSFSDGHVARLEEVSSGDCTDNQIVERGQHGKRPRNRGGVCLFVETADTPVKPGWSGGPLYDSSGRVVGMLVSASKGGDLVVAVPADWITEAQEAAVLQRHVISGWIACSGDFECVKKVIQEALFHYLPPKARFRGEVLAEWAKKLADRGNYEEARNVANGLSTGPRIDALLGIAAAYARSNNREAAKVVFDQVTAFALDVRRRPTVRVRELIAIAETQARNGFLKESEATFFAALEASEHVEGTVQTRVKSLLWIGSAASGVGLLGLADSAFSKGLVLATSIGRKNLRKRLVRSIELEISISRLARGDSLRELQPQLRIEERLADANRFIRERRSLATTLGFVEQNARLAGQLFRSGEETLAQSLFSALIEVADLGWQEDQARAFSAIGDELFELDPDLSANLYLRAVGALASVTKFWEDLEAEHAKKGKPQSERKTSRRLDRARFMVVEGLTRIDNYEDALKLVSQIDEVRLREKGYQRLAKALVSAGEREKGFRTATNVLNGALFTSVFIAGTRPYNE